MRMKTFVAGKIILYHHPKVQALDLITSRARGRRGALIVSNTRARSAVSATVGVEKAAATPNTSTATNPWVYCWRALELDSLEPDASRATRRGNDPAQGRVALPKHVNTPAKSVTPSSAVPATNP